MIIMKSRLFILLAFLLSGCSSVWVPVSGGSKFTQAEANAVCKPEALHLYPIKNEVAQRSVMSYVEKNAKKMMIVAKTKLIKNKHQLWKAM